MDGVSLSWLPSLAEKLGSAAVIFAMFIITLVYLQRNATSTRAERNEQAMRDSEERLKRESQQIEAQKAREILLLTEQKEREVKTLVEQKEREDRAAEQGRFMLKMVFDHQTQLNKQREQEHKEDFEVLNKFATTIDSHTAQLALLVGAIQNNQWCPAVREASHK